MYNKSMAKKKKKFAREIDCCFNDWEVIEAMVDKMIGCYAIISDTIVGECGTARITDTIIDEDFLKTHKGWVETWAHLSEDDESVVTLSLFENHLIEGGENMQRTVVIFR